MAWTRSGSDSPVGLLDTVSIFPPSGFGEDEWMRVMQRVEDGFPHRLSRRMLDLLHITSLRSGANGAKLLRRNFGETLENVAGAGE